MLTISSSVRLTKSQDGGILLDVEQGQIFRLNPVGTRILELLEEGHDGPSLTHALSSELDVPEQVVREDVRDFLSQLRERRLIEGLGAEAESVGAQKGTRFFPFPKPNLGGCLLCGRNEPKSYSVLTARHFLCLKLRYRRRNELPQISIAKSSDDSDCA